MRTVGCEILIMTSVSPLLTKKQHGKSKKYVVGDQTTDDISPYVAPGKVHTRKKSMKAEGQSVDPKLCHQYEEALRRRDFRQVLWMITNGNICANHETRTGETALLAAVSAKNLDALSILMTNGISIDTSNRQGYTPLMKAIAVAVPRRNCLFNKSAMSNNNVEESTQVYDNDIVANVLNYEPNLLQTDKSGRTAFDWAKLTGNLEALKWLEKRQRDKSIKHQSAANRQERVAQCLELLHQHEEYIQSIKHLIASQFFGEEALVTFLKSATITSAEFTQALSDLKDMDGTSRSRSFQSQFFVNVETREGWTPVAKCAAFGYVAAVQELLARGADLHYETRLRHTAMTWASYCGHEAVVLHLLRIRVNLDQKTRDGKTALMHAISNSQAKIVHHLLIATRDQCFPSKPIETFSSEIDLKVSKLKFCQKPKELKTIETEWHLTFLKKISWKDQTGRDALELAQLAVEQVLEDGSSSHREEELPPAIQVLHQVQTAIKEAEEHKNYVETHADRTKITVCHNEGCSFMAPKDVLPTHENHHCVKRTIKCDNCSASVIFEDRRRHDEQLCPTRRVTCTNFQFGIESIISVFTVEKDLWNVDFCVELLYVFKN
ncbi:Ankyrin repeat domain-containing protein 17 [Phytophthora citrophthora]|uniref:Ankyrin repeat domain-containing protein 17 n=1 Tax=Phytophthora citrophthora TaxID=4793 RepID=A0AAD9GYD0_9STRA|nr:Ankyrin repeat domain-containing protein 17 [Phytophthora citrophthora]